VQWMIDLYSGVWRSSAAGGLRSCFSDLSGLQWDCSKAGRTFEEDLEMIRLPLILSFSVLDDQRVQFTGSIQESVSILSLSLSYLASLHSSCTKLHPALRTLLTWFLIPRPVYQSIIMWFITALALFAGIAVAQISSEPNSSDCDGIYLVSPSTRAPIDVNTYAGTIYSQQNINDAATAALNYYAQGQTVGSDGYPHQYHDYEGFSFSCSSPYLEFPILTSGTYSGGSPGADRVVIGSISSDDSSAQYCAVITHDGQSGNDFGECSDS